MANVNGPNGFQPTGSLNGGPIQGNIYSKAVGYGTALFPGDIVGRAADGTIDRELTPGTTLIQGVNMDYGAASALTEHLVIDNPLAIFRAQSSGSLVAADMGLNANFAEGAGDTTLIRSKDVIDSDTEAVTATLDLHLLNRAKIVGNEWGAYVKLLVTLNQHRLANIAAGT